MENHEQGPIEPQSVEQAVEKLVDHDVAAVEAFMRAHPEEISEICLQLSEKYPPNDQKTPVMKLAMLIESLLK